MAQHAAISPPMEFFVPHYNTFDSSRVAPLATIESNQEFLSDDLSCHINWLQRSDRKKSPFMTSDRLYRAGIQDLLQQEASEQLCNSTLDQPSQLVRVECYKIGCRCVLKREPALAMKVVSGISMVQGTWHPSSGIAQASSVTSLHENWLKFPKLSHHRSKSSKSHSQMSLLGAMSEKFAAKETSTPIILTSCCPSWFEVVQKSSSGPEDPHPNKGPALPCWNSVNALWKAFPGLALVKKQVKCFLPKVASPDNNPLLHGPYFLPTGCVLQLLGQRTVNVCTEDKSRRNLAQGFKTVSQPMLQCALVGGKTVKDVISKMLSLGDREFNCQCALESLSETHMPCPSNPEQILYLSFEEKNTAFSPVAPSSMLQGKVHLSKEVDAWSGGGVHSLINLLSNYRLPILVKPVLGRSIADWLPSNKNSAGLEPMTEDANGLLRITQCYNGILIFLEPINDCDDQTVEALNSNSKQTSSRFFVVTADMLSDHAFLVADQVSCDRNMDRLKTHANRVAHFLAACHPVYGLAYLLKYAENVTQNSSTGPVHMPLTRSLGPPNVYHRQITLKSTLSSIAAIAAIHLGELVNANLAPVISRQLVENNSSNSSNLSRSSDAENSMVMNEILNEIEDIYFYVRTGRFPTASKFNSQCSPQQNLKHRSLSGPSHQHLKMVRSCPQPTRMLTVLSPAPQHQAPTQLMSPLPSVQQDNFVGKTLNHARQKSHEIKTSLSQCLPLFRQTQVRSPLKCQPMVTNDQATLGRSKSNVRQNVPLYYSGTYAPTPKQFISAPYCSPVSPIRLLNVPKQKQNSQPIYLIQQPSQYTFAEQHQQQFMQVMPQVFQPVTPQEFYQLAPQDEANRLVGKSLTESMMFLSSRNEAQPTLSPALHHPNHHLLSSLASSISDAGAVMMNSNESTLASKLHSQQMGLGGFRQGHETKTQTLLNRKTSDGSSRNKLLVHSAGETTPGRPTNSSPDTGLGGDSSLAALNMIWTLQDGRIAQ
ncbi:hypothetical protein Ciccas_007462 [Cichlidogyrus casuarinus]|uniref:Uncharacterized protein n=1 Tax=Cichlidogyrus casuarinus TaxID=1844966 RepID=A0ABD2Q3J8_9PLAT